MTYCLVNNKQASNQTSDAMQAPHFTNSFIHSFIHFSFLFFSSLCLCVLGVYIYGDSNDNDRHMLNILQCPHLCFAKLNVTFVPKKKRNVKNANVMNIEEED